MSDEYFIADLRPAFASNPYITFWCPENAGYTYPLVWAGRYSAEEVRKGGSYYTKFEGNALIRCAVPCDDVRRISAEPARGMVDGDTGPVVLNTPQIRGFLRICACADMGEDGAPGPADELLTDAIRNSRSRSLPNLASYPLALAIMDGFEVSPTDAELICVLAGVDPKSTIVRLQSNQNVGRRP